MTFISMPTLTSQKLWKIKDPNPQLQLALHNDLGVHPIIAQLLINRGIMTTQEADSFLSADLSKLHDPFLLKDMDKAVSRVRQAREKKERVLIFGDYDVDGVTSLTILHNALVKIGIDVITHIPHRMHDGYGLNEDIGKIAKEKGVSLLITVDCGITALSEVDIINECGIDVIIFDHHEPAEQGLPKAFAVVNPKRKDCPYPFKSLASVGLVAKFIHAIFGKFQEDTLDLVALGTIADVAPLRGENRIFVKAGLPRIRETKNKGLSALMDVAKIKGKKFRAHHAGFVLGPRINSSGRMGSAKKSLDLLLSQDHEGAYTLAQHLEETNRERQKLQRDVVQEAISLVEREVNFKEHKVIVVSKEGWHKGVLGIVASRVAEMYYRPAIIISIQDGMGTASARSIQGFHLNEALAHCSEILEAFGGHKLAAGLTIREENVGNFRDLINHFANDILEVCDLMPTLDIDCEIPLSSLSLDLINKIDLLEPYGQGNPAPVFCSRNLIVKTKPMVMGKNTLKFWVTDPSGQMTVSAVGFGMGKCQEFISVGQRIDLAYEMAIDDWNKPAVVQLKLKDMRGSE